MNILLIGNGFDLAHGLPTRYEDFLCFGEKIKKIYTYEMKVTPEEYIKNELKDWQMVDSLKEQLEFSFRNRKFEKKKKSDDFNVSKVIIENWAITELYELLNKNSWFDYFCMTETYIGENWIDFENEISKVIQILNEIRDLTILERDITQIENNKSKVMMTLLKVSTGSFRENFGSVKKIDNFILKLENDLYRLIRALEIYLNEFVGKIEVSTRIKDIEELNIDKVLSFNYTDTYAKIYGQGNKVEYDYIHGVAIGKNSIEANNMVVGIDEYLTEDKVENNTVFIGFKKYYQRILKSTESNYFDWLDIINEDYEIAKLKSLQFKGTIGEMNRKAKPSDFACNSQLYIFGHSLDVTDRDVLKPLICNDNIRTKIFYYREYEDDKRTLGKLIKNLVKIIGMKELIKRTSGATKLIEFLPQTIVK